MFGSVLSTPLEICNLSTFVFIWDSLNKTAIPYNEMSLLDILSILNILTIINLKCLKYIIGNRGKSPEQKCCILLLSCVGVYSSTVKAFSVCTICKTYLRGADQRSCVVSINLGASPKFHHLCF